MENLVSITATELKHNLGRYLDKVGSGTPVIVSKHGTRRMIIMPCQAEEQEAEGAQEYTHVSETAKSYQPGPAVMSYQAFMDMYEATEERMEFIDGEVYLLTTPTVVHQEIAGNILVLFRNWLKGKPCKAFIAPFDVHFHKKGNDCPDVCQPDVLIACDAVGNINEKGKYMGTPALVVEILSPSTRSKDMVKKLNTYMLSGVKEFWVADPAGRTVLLYLFKDCEIEGFLSLKDGEVVASQAFPGMEVSMADVFEG